MGNNMVTKAGIRCDALSFYGTAPRVNNTPYATLAAEEVAQWDSLASRGLPVVPTFTPLYDPRPM
jgi:hypothetical protein